MQLVSKGVGEVMQITSKIILAAALLLAVVTSAIAQKSDADTPARELVADIGRIVTPNGVQESFEVTLGGARQIVNVRGANRTNPILLFVHGGPGATQMPIAWTWQRPWEDFFTVVQWDQRSAGRSYSLNDPATLAPTMTPDRYRDDAIELIELLLKRYGKRKILLLGHSWGSVIGLSVAAKRPDLLHAYIGMGQVINSPEGERLSFEWTLARARDAKNATAIRELEALRPYPGPGPHDLAKLAVQRKWNAHYGAFAWGRSDGGFYNNAPRLSPEYSETERTSRDQGSAFSLKTVWPQMAKVNFDGVKRLDVPVIQLLGRHDYRTPAPITEKWMGHLRAPRKTIIWFENSAHLPMIEEPGHVLAALLTHALPLARDSSVPGQR